MNTKPALKHVLVLPERHAQIMNILDEMKQIFYERAKAQGVPIKSRREGRNVPGQAEAAEYLFQKSAIQGDFITLFVDELLQKAKGAQNGS